MCVSSARRWSVLRMKGVDANGMRHHMIYKSSVQATSLDRTVRVIAAGEFTERMDWPGGADAWLVAHLGVVPVIPRCGSIDTGRSRAAPDRTERLRREMGTMAAPHHVRLSVRVEICSH